MDLSPSLFFLPFPLDGVAFIRSHSVCFPLDLPTTIRQAILVMVIQNYCLAASIFDQGRALGRSGLWEDDLDL
jgi:hypothetical protein